MPVAFILDFDGATSAQYDAVIEEMQLGGRTPPGALYHAAGPTETGWRVVDVWETDEAFQDFTARTVAPATQAHGLAEPRVQRLEVAQVREGGSAGSDAALLQVVRMPGVTAETFHAADAQVLPLPDEIVFHVNGPDEGGWFVIDTWTSKEARDAFLEERVRPAFETAGLTGPPAFEDMSLHATMMRA
ncbi:hypothetical protein [Capillimicrobium parvum]|uniref:ABM domain-containing protein n=1 Tax=Capillimicrobium parvum TaxID=2884022 RepID=A0A9E6Y1Q1_9ACTN|nr:hypothetical protein [Capillimicrobium parvum]UGS38017.1 hypothetical protein DSM104329_04439 [Capillimicrobium parvum]